MGQDPDSPLSAPPRWDEFEAVDAATWRAKVDADLKGRPFEKLVDHGIEGLPIAPLYGSDDAPATDVYARRRGRPGGWCIATEQSAGTDTARRLAHDAAFGATAAWLRTSSPVSLATAKSWREAMGPEGELCVVVSDSSGVEAVEGMRVLWDPVGAAMRGEIPRDAAAQGGWAKSLQAHLQRFESGPAESAVLVDVGPVCAAGGDAPEQLGVFLAGALTYLRWHGETGASGITTSDLASRFWASFEVGRDVFVEIAKLRAARRLWAKLLSALGETEASVLASLQVRASGSRRVRTERDPWVNLLRGTTETFAAAVGGADHVATLSLDGELHTHPRHGGDFGRRLAVNTQVLLAQESHLGAVADPAGGSHHVEALTDALARAGWRAFQRIEREGGLLPSLAAGTLQARVEAQHQKSAAQVARRKMAIVGVSEFASLTSHPVPDAAAGDRTAHSSLRAGDFAALPVRRLAEPFEKLRARAEALNPKPIACLLGLGALSEHKPRADFAANLLAAGGIPCVTTSPVHEVGELQDALAEALGDGTGPTVVVLCGSDAGYERHAVAVARALRERAPNAKLALAGRPGALEHALTQAGLDIFLYLGCDALAVLETLLNVPNAEAADHD